MNEGTTFADACAAIEEVLPRFTELLRRNHSVTTSAIGDWTLPEVACHVSHVISKDTDSLAGRMLPDVELSPAAVGVATNEMLADDPERDLVVLADRIDTLGATFLALRAHPPTAPVIWIGGTKLAPSAVACHLLEELLVHGHDVARAAGTRWRTEPRHAALAILGAAVPIIAASPQSWLRPGYEPHRRVRVQFRLRGHGSYAIALDDGLAIEMPPAQSHADAYLSADPSALLLLLLGRISPLRTVATGKAFVWGRRPQALQTVRKAMLPP